MNTRRLIFFIIASFLFVCTGLMAANAPAPKIPTPDKVVQQTATQILAAVNEKRDELKKNPQELNSLIGNILSPHFDLGYASRLVLGPYWRTATPAQRQAFQDAFYKYLVHSYSHGLLQDHYSGNNIHVDPWRGSPDETHAMVRSEVMRASNAPPVQVDYAMIRTKDGWKAFDVRIEGISYVMNYRNQFGPEIQQKGIDELIKRLNVDAEKPPETQTQGGGS
ncbi:MAG: MlaC/ttg2D family ABC transporter substrate-binding protein [Gammaproteobacteria bacterium]